MKKLKYFAYGSNMSSMRMKARVPSAAVIYTSVIEGISAIEDSDKLREASELAVYG
jgi:hypothetical protein